MHAQLYDYIGISHETKLYFPHNSKELAQCYITSEITLWIFFHHPIFKIRITPPFCGQEQSPTPANRGMKNTYLFWSDGECYSKPLDLLLTSCFNVYLKHGRTTNF